MNNHVNVEDITRPPTDFAKSGQLIRGKEAADELIVVGGNNLRKAPKEKRVAMDNADLNQKIFELFNNHERLQID